jgi:hypothetical protein
MMNILSYEVSTERGQGQTVLLGEFHRMAKERDWITVIIEPNTVSPLSTLSFDTSCARQPMFVCGL